MFEGLIVKGALMAIGGGITTVILGFLGWGIVQFVLAKYGKKKNGNGNGNGNGNRYVTMETCNAHHEEMKDLIRLELKDIKQAFKDEIVEERISFEKQLEKERDFTSSVNNRLWGHVNDKVAHGGG